MTSWEPFVCTQTLSTGSNRLVLEGPLVVSAGVTTVSALGKVKMVCILLLPSSEI